MVLFDKYTIDLELIIRPVIYIIIGFIVFEIIKNLIKKAEDKSMLKKRHQKKRMKTINSLIINIIRYIIIVIVSTMILSNFGVNVQSIVAGLGITAAILGLAFQDVAKDFLAGISIILEDQYEIGDLVEINCFTGEVVSLGLKTTRLKNFKGQTLIIANHTITQIINYNLNNTKAIVDIAVGYEYSSDEVEKVLNKLFEKLDKNIPKTVGKIEILGITELEESGVIYRISVETLPGEHIDVERRLRREIKEALDKAKIKIPYKQIEVHNGK